MSGTACVLDLIRLFRSLATLPSSKYFVTYLYSGTFSLKSILQQEVYEKTNRD